jgi:hypothetical protein
VALSLKTQGNVVTDGRHAIHQWLVVSLHSFGCPNTDAAVGLQQSVQDVSYALYRYDGRLLFPG